MRTPEQIRAYRAEWSRNRRRQIAYGRWQPTERLDPAPVREHIASLRRFGMSVQTIALLAGEPVGAMSQIIYPNHSDYLKWITPERAARILAVRFDLDAIPTGRKVDAAGTRRRIEALMCLGWSQGHIGRELGISRERVSRYRHNEHVDGASARRVRDLYDRWWRLEGPEVRAKNMAVRLGFAPPAAWDDETIDDPTAEPQGIARTSKRGRPAEDVAEDVEWLLRHDDTLTADALGVRLGYADSSGVQNALARAGRADLLDRLARNAELAGHTVTRRSA